MFTTILGIAAFIVLVPLALKIVFNMVCYIGIEILGHATLQAIENQKKEQQSVKIDN